MIPTRKLGQGLQVSALGFAASVTLDAAELLLIQEKLGALEVQGERYAGAMARMIDR